MAEDLADLRVRISAEHQRFTQGLQRSEQAVGRFTSSVTNRMGQAERRFSRFSTTASQTSGVFSRQFRPAMQQVGFQVGDIATQLSLGTNAMQVFAIQGGQLISFFGAFGALAGAALTILGGLAVAYLDVGNAAEKLGDTIDQTNSDLENLRQVEQQLEDDTKALEAANDDLAAAIAAGGSAAIDTARTEVAAIERRIAANESLRQKYKDVLIAQQAVLQAELSLAEGRFREQFAGGGATFQQAVNTGASGGEFGTIQPRGGELTGLQEDRIHALTAAAREAAEQGEATGDQLKLLQADKALQERRVQVLELEQALERLAKTGSAALPETDDLDSGRRGGGADARSSERSFEPFSELDARIDALRREADLIGLTEAATVRKTAAYEAERIAVAALNQIRQEGREPTAEEIAQARQLADEITRLTVANWEAEDAIRAQAEAARDAEERQRALANAITQVGDEIVRVIEEGGSLLDVLKAIAQQILSMPQVQSGLIDFLGGALGGIIGGAGGGVTTAANTPFQGASAAIFNSAGGINLPFRQHGGPVQAGQPYVVGEKRPELFVPDVSGTILPSVPGRVAASQMAGAASGGARPLNITVNVTAQDARGVREAGGTVARKTAEAARRGGGYL